MIASKEEIKDWIRYGYDSGATYMFLIKKTDKIKPYWARPGENVEVVREMITASGEKIVNELNLDIRLLFLNTVK